MDLKHVTQVLQSQGFTYQIPSCRAYTFQLYTRNYRSWMYKSGTLFLESHALIFENDVCLNSEDIPTIRSYSLSEDVSPVRYIQDGPIVESPIPAMIGCDSDSWMFSLAETVDELHHILLYLPDRKEHIEDDIFLFLRRNVPIVLSIGGECYTYTTVDPEYKHLLSPEPACTFICMPAESSGISYYPSDLFMQIVENNVQQYRYLVKKYDIAMVGQCDTEFFVRDTYAICIEKIMPNVICSGDINEEDIIQSIEEIYYQKGYAVEHEGYSCKGTAYIDEIMEMYLSEYNPSITISAGTVVECNGRIILLSKPIVAIDGDKFPKSWEGYDVLDEYIDQNDSIYLWSHRDVTLTTHSDLILESNISTVMKVYIMWIPSISAYFVSPVYKRGYTPYSFIGTEIETTCKTLPPRVAIFSCVEKSLSDISIR